MDSKTRAYLKGLAMKIQPTTQVGKNGITQNVLAQIDEVLEARELVKITVFKNSDIACKDIINELAQQLQAEPVQFIGNKIVLYRFSKKDDVRHILDF